MSNVQALFGERVEKCRPGQPAYHPKYGWGTVVAACGLHREIEVVTRIECRDSSGIDLGNVDQEFLLEEVFQLETFDVHVSELVCPTMHATTQRTGQAKVFSIGKS